jgi:nucleoside-diphosphate-sugar epimerase
VVVVGSSEELGVIAAGGIPNSPYSAAKSAATAYARMFAYLYALPVVVVRLFMGYGPRQPLTKVVPYTVTSLLAGKRPQLTSGQRVFDWIFSSDVVDGLLRVGAANDLIGETVDLGTGRGASIREVVDLLVELTGSPPSLPEYEAIPERLGERSQIADVDRLQRLLDWRPRWSLRDGLAETVEWYRRTHYSH